MKGGPKSSVKKCGQPGEMYSCLSAGDLMLREATAPSSVWKTLEAEGNMDAQGTCPSPNLRLLNQAHSSHPGSEETGVGTFDQVRILTMFPE